MKSIRQTRSRRYTKRKTLRQKRSRSRSRRSLRTRRTRKSRRIRRQRGGQTTVATNSPAVTTSVGCQIKAPLVDLDALAMQQHHPTPNVTQPQSNSYNNYALVNDRSHLYVKM